MANRVNVFLERARQLSSISPLKIPAKTPTKSADDKTARSISPNSSEKPFQSNKKTNDPDVINNLESMIENFLQSRYNIHKKIENHKQKELKVISELKKTLEDQIEKSKSNDLQICEKIYQAKAEKVLMIVKQEALNMDKKLAALNEENFRLKKALLEKKIEYVDNKILGKVLNADEVVAKLAQKSFAKGSEESIEKIVNLKRFCEFDEVFQNIQDFEEVYHEICWKIIEIRKDSKEFNEKAEKRLENMKKIAENISLQIKKIENGRHLDENTEKYVIKLEGYQESIFSIQKKEEKQSFESNHLENIENTPKLASEYENIDELFILNPEITDELLNATSEDISSSAILENLYDEILDELE